MSGRPPASQAARWITIDPDRVAQVVEDILREEAWWTAVRNRKFACEGLWADGGSQELPANYSSPAWRLDWPGAQADSD